MRALFTQQRGAHTPGVQGVGAATVVSSPQFPEHELFKPGYTFPMRLRHSNLIRPDHAFTDIRAVCLKFADHDFDSPFDLFMNTGKEAAFWSIESFDQMLPALGSPESFKKLMLDSPWA